MAKRFQFSYPYASYMDISLMRETHTRKELLAEYRKMAAEANKRLARLEKYKWMKDSDAYEYNKDKYKGPTSRMTKAELTKQMREAAIFLSSKSSTVQGQRHRRDELLYTFREEWGLDFLNKSNTVAFARFLGSARAHYGSGNYTFTEIEALFRVSMKDKELDKELIKSDFEKFKEEAQKSEYYEGFYREAKDRYSSAIYDNER